MEKVESHRRVRRKNKLTALILEVGGAAQLARESGTPKTHISAMLAGRRGLGDTLAGKLESLYAKPEGWFDADDHPPNPRQKTRPDELVIPQFETGGAMGNGLLLRDQPGLIRGWTVTQEWLAKNIKSHTAHANLCIVTGFGDSMKGMFNSGDPLVIDRGITTLDYDGVYFFRVAQEGFIKRLQRIPGEGIRVLSENTKYESWTIKPEMDFEVFGRVLKAWQGEDF